MARRSLPQDATRTLRRPSAARRILRRSRGQVLRRISQGVSDLWAVEILGCGVLWAIYPLAQGCSSPCLQLVADSLQPSCSKLISHSLYHLFIHLCISQCTAMIPTPIIQERMIIVVKL